MCAKKDKSPAATIAFRADCVPISLALLAHAKGLHVNYVAEADLAEPIYRTPDGLLKTGYLELFKHLWPSMPLEVELLVSTAVIPLLYSVDQPAQPEMLETVVSMIVQDEPVSTGHKELDYIIIGAPQVDLITGHPKGASLLDAYASDVALKVARGQTSMAVKNYTRSLLPKDGPVLDNAEIGKVCTRFPPEPSGYLHIGHAKAAMLNHYFARAYKGRLHFRMDDTNPGRENPEFVENLKRDMNSLQLDFDSFSYTSDHFELMLRFAEKLIRDGLAYCDKTPSEEMQKRRFDGTASDFREIAVDESLRLWEEMKRGSEEGQLTCLRAKISVDDPNKCMRDPVIYRVNVKDEHHRTGTKYKVYPTYDFACPIVDSVEGITHALRTTEFLDRNNQYWWFCDKLGLRKPELYDFSRLRLQYSIMSKRHLQWFVEEGLVEGWFDPRFPTVQGLMRRGLRPDALRKFILDQGPSRRNNYQEWSKIWAVNKQFIEPIAKRFHAVHADDAVTVQIVNFAPKYSFYALRDVPLHAKNADLGTKQVLYRPEVLIDSSDFKQMEEHGLKVGDKLTLMTWGNMQIEAIDYAAQTLALRHMPDDTDYSGTLKITWVGKSRTVKRVRTCYFGHLITKDILGPDDDFKDFVNKNSLKTFDAYVQGNILQYIKPKETLQLERWGFYYFDRLENGIPILHYVPEGRGHAQVGAFTFSDE